MNNLRENKPTADILMLSMRAMGYSFESAVADIVDNSISAEAKRISIRFAIDPKICMLQSVMTVMECHPKNCSMQ